MKKYNAGTNKQHGGNVNVKRIEELSEDPDAPLHQEKISLSIARTIQQARNENGWTQRELATKINEKASVITDLESGRGTPDQQVLGKLERVLEVKLRGKKN